MNMISYSKPGFFMRVLGTLEILTGLYLGYRANLQLKDENRFVAPQVHERPEKIEMPLEMEVTRSDKDWFKIQITLYGRDIGYENVSSEDVMHRVEGFRSVSGIVTFNTTDKTDSFTEDITKRLLPCTIFKTRYLEG